MENKMTIVFEWNDNRPELATQCLKAYAQRDGCIAKLTTQTAAATDSADIDDMYNDWLKRTMT